MVLSFLDYFTGVLGFIKSRKKGVGVWHGGVDFGKVEVGGIGKEGFVNTAAADDEDFFVGVLVVVDELFYVVDNAVGTVEVARGEDDVLTVGEFTG